MFASVQQIFTKGNHAFIEGKVCFDEMLGNLNHDITKTVAIGEDTTHV